MFWDFQTQMVLSHVIYNLIRPVSSFHNCFERDFWLRLRCESQTIVCYSIFSLPFLLAAPNSFRLILPDAVSRQILAVRSEAQTSESVQQVGGSFWRTTSNYHSYSECGLPAIQTSSLALIDLGDSSRFNELLGLLRRVPKMLIKRGGTDSFCYREVQVLKDTGPARKLLVLLLPLLRNAPEICSWRSRTF